MVRSFVRCDRNTHDSLQRTLFNTHPLASLDKLAWAWIETGGTYGLQGFNLAILNGCRDSTNTDK